MKRLYRTRHGAVIGGVCGGIAEYFNVDPVFVRLAWAVTIFMGGVGIFAYIVAWLIIPTQPSGFEPDYEPRFDANPPMRADLPASPLLDDGQSVPIDDDSDPQLATADVTVHRPGGTPPDVRSGGSGSASGAQTFGIVLIVLGGFWLARNLVPWLGLHRFWPLALVLIGLYMVLTAFRRD